jgi:hypothetical protein
MVNKKNILHKSKALYFSVVNLDMKIRSTSSTSLARHKVQPANFFASFCFDVVEWKFSLMILVHSILIFCFSVSSYRLFARCNNFLPKHHTPQMPHGTSLGLPSKPRSSTRPNGRLVQCTPLGKKLDICSTSGNQMKSEV